MHHETLSLKSGEFIGEISQHKINSCASVCIIGKQPYIEPHEHQDSHFVYLLNGMYKSNARGAEGYIGANSLIFNSPGVRHQDRFVSAGTLMTFTPKESFLRKAKVPRPAPEETFLIPQNCTKPIFGQIWNEFTQSDALSDFVIESLTLELMASAIRSSKSDFKKHPDWLHIVCDRLDDTFYEEAPKITELAHEVGIHPVYLARAFRRFMGDSPGNYLRRSRARRAAGLLSENKMSLVEIALACGYADQAAFTKGFRRSTGLSPGTFRQKWCR